MGLDGTSVWDLRKMTQAYLALLVCVFAQLVMVILTAPSAPGMEGHIPESSMSCDPKNSTCPENYCCVIKVITYADVSKQAVGFTECQQLRKFKQFCLVESEDFMCPCQNGLICKAKYSENFGHCDKGID